MARRMGGIRNQQTRARRLPPAMLSVFAVLQVLQCVRLPAPTIVVVESLSVPSRSRSTPPLTATSLRITTLPLTSTLTSTSTSVPERTRIQSKAGRKSASASIPHTLLRASPDDTTGSKFTAGNVTTAPASDKDSKGNKNNALADDSNGDSETKGGLLPSYKQLIVFTATTILIWLSEPLLSLVDTTIVGLTASAESAVVQIAALGPATTLFDSLVYTTYFLAIATTNQLAPGLAEAAATETGAAASACGSKNPWRDLRKSASHLLGLAIVFGSLVSAITFVFGRGIIEYMVGAGSTNMGAAEAGAIVPLATNYARIRAAVAPVSILGFVAQSFCLVNLDIATPAIAVAAASVVNVVGDLALSARYGIQGAAVATAMATVTSCAILLRKVRKTTNRWKMKQEDLERGVAASSNHGANEVATRNDADAGTDTDTDTKTPPATNEVPTETTNMSTGSSERKSTEQILDNKNKNNNIPFWSIPDRTSMVNLFKLAGPIFFVMMAKVACYNIMTIRATTLGIVPLASHNIMMRVFFFFACFGDSLSQAAQSFYPQVEAKERGKLIRRLFWIASFVGLSNNQSSQLILKKLGRFLAKDASIIDLMAQHAPWVGCAVLLHPFIMLLEGTVLANRDLVFMVGTYSLTSLLHLSFVFSPISSTFTGLWRALFGFQLIRLVQFALRVWIKSRASTGSSTNYSSIGNADQEGIPAPPL